MARDHSISVCGLPCGTSDTELRQLFEVFGPIASTRVSGGSNLRGQCTGLVHFRSPTSATTAIATMKGFHHKGASIQVQLAAYRDVAPNESLAYDTPSRFLERVRIYDGRLTGYVLSWKGQYGWIAADTRVSHPLADKHEGRVFVDVQDVEGRDELRCGERVSFVAYADSDGIGASEVCVLGPGSGQGPRGSGSRGYRGTQVRVDRWPPNLQDTDFMQIVQQFGQVKSAVVYPPRQEGGRASGLVVFATHESAQLAVDHMDGTTFGDEALHVRFGEDDEEDERGESPSTTASSAAMASTAPAPAAAAAAVPDVEAPGDVVTLATTRMMGTVRSWKGRYGWITADKRIPQPAKTKHRGWVFVDVRDLEEVSELHPGDRCSFIIYKDDQGIGAARVRVERSSDRGGGPGEASAQAPSATQAAEAPRRPRWWRELAGDCCPISLTPLEELEYEPFGLMGTTGGGEGKLAFDGLWGSAGVAAFLSVKPVHWFDGRFLACSLVSKGQLVDPVNMRPLSRSECESLDEYLAANGHPAVHVAETFDISCAIAAEGADEGDRARLTSLGQDAASLLRIFDEEPGPSESTQAAQAGPAASSVTPAPSAPSRPSASSGAATAAAAAATDGAGARRRRWGRDK